MAADKMSAAPPSTNIGIPPIGIGLTMVAMPLNMRNHAWSDAMLSDIGETVKRSKRPESRSRAPIGSKRIGSILFQFYYFVRSVS